MKKSLLVFTCIVAVIFLHAQPAIQWQKALGGSAADYAQAIDMTPDGGFIVAGYSQSTNGDVTSNYGNTDVWVTKLDNAGNLQWQKSLGGTNFDFTHSIQTTSDSGFIIAGYTASNDVDVSGNHGSDDFWLVKLNSVGLVQWQACLGGSGLDDAFSIQETSDAGFIITGDTQSNDGDVSGNHGNFDVWVVKVTNAGAIQWKKCLGGAGDDTGAAVKQTSDNGFIIGGSSNSTDGDVTGNHGGFDYWVVKLDSAGTLLWEQSVGGTLEDIGYSITLATDSGYVIAGFSKSVDGDVTGNHGTGTLPDFWVVKLSPSGSIQWQKCLGGTGDDKAYSIDWTSDNGYVVAGYTKSNNGDVVGSHGTLTHDYWITKLDSVGNLQWQKCLGGTATDWARSVKETVPGEYVVTGWAASGNGDVTGAHGGNDFWVVKLSGITTGISEENSFNWVIYPNPSHGIFTLDGNLKIGTADVKVLNSLGQIVFESQVSSENMVLDLSKIPAGIYSVIIIAGKTYVQKVIIQ